METTGRGLKVHRRQFLQATAVAAASFGLSSPFFAQLCPPKAGTVRDKLWLFSNPTDADYDIIHKRSVMSPFEAAVYMGIPNIFMVQQYKSPHEEPCYEPFEPPFEQYQLVLNMLKRVAWSLVGAGGATRESERKQVLAMAQRTPNIVGVYLDDFFGNKQPGRVASLTLDQLRDIQRQIKGPNKKMDMYVTFYARNLGLPITEYLKLIDVITYWMRKPEELEHQDLYLGKLEKLAPHCRIMLGVDTFALDRKKTPPATGMPIPLMQEHCERALRWLRGGRIEGIVIYGGTTLDVGFESVNWTRDWIQKVGDTRL